jgi:hypothetical protein
MKRLKVTLVIVVIIAAIVGLNYVDYTIYKAKYPNTTVWMWMIDNNK